MSCMVTDANLDPAIATQPARRRHTNPDPSPDPADVGAAFLDGVPPPAAPVDATMDEPTSGGDIDMHARAHRASPSASGAAAATTSRLGLGASSAASGASDSAASFRL